MATFSLAPEETVELVNKVIAECYPDLRDLMDAGKHRFPFTLQVLNVYADQDANGEPKGAAIKERGRAVHADIRVVNKQDRALGKADVLLRIDGDGWDEMSEQEQEALVDHELHHLIPLKGKDDAWKKDDLGRQMFGIKEHDVEVGWFLEVAKRRTHASIEVKQARAIADKWGQYLFFFDATPLAIQGKPKARKGKPQETAEEPPPWRIWQQLSPDEQEYVTEALGDRFDATQQFLVVIGGIAEQRPIGEPAAEEDVTPAKAPRQRKAAAKKGARK